jgi:hypothetical protein
MTEVHVTEARAWAGPLDGQMLPTGGPGVIYSTLTPSEEAPGPAPMPEQYVLHKYGWYLDRPPDMDWIENTPQFTGWAYIRRSDVLKISHYITCGGTCVIQIMRWWWGTLP